MVSVPPELGELARTCVGPLFARACESRAAGGLLCDPKAEELAEQLEHDAADLDWPMYQLLIGIRTEIIDEATTAFLTRCPEGLVVDLGAGLDTRFERLDNGLVRWYELDLPPVIELRRRFFAEGDRHCTIPLSVLDVRWMEALPDDAPMLFIMEGLANYLEERQARAVLGAIARRFPGAEVVMDALGLLWVRLMRNPMYRWGVCADNSPAQWHPQLKLVDSWYVLDRHPERWRQFPWLWPLWPLRRNAQVIFHLRAEA